MLGAAVVGGIILGMIEGISLGISRISGQMVLNEQEEKLPHGDLLALEESARERGLLDTEGRIEVCYVCYY